MNLELKEEFHIEENGVEYHLPCYEVVDGFGIREVEGDVVIKFVRGSKLKDEDVERREGTLHEHLLAAMIHDLKFKDQIVPSREGSLVITKLEEAMGWLRHRQIDRAKRQVLGTYKK